MTFKPRKNWLEEPKLLAERIAQIIGYVDSCPPYPKKVDANVVDNTHWTLNATNDWWLRILKNDECELAYRYKYDEDQWTALRTVIEMFVGMPRE